MTRISSKVRLSFELVPFQIPDKTECSVFPLQIANRICIRETNLNRSDSILSLFRIYFRSNPIPQLVLPRETPTNEMLCSECFRQRLRVRRRNSNLFCIPRCAFWNANNNSSSLANRPFCISKRDASRTVESSVGQASTHLMMFLNFMAHENHVGLTVDFVFTDMLYRFPNKQG